MIKTYVDFPNLLPRLITISFITTGEDFGIREDPRSEDQTHDS